MKRQNLINDSILWSRIKDYAARVGRVSARPVVLLYSYGMLSPRNANMHIVISGKRYA